jgi:hypothetical protein
MLLFTSRSDCVELYIYYCLKLFSKIVIEYINNITKLYLLTTYFNVIIIYLVLIFSFSILSAIFHVLLSKCFFLSI